MSTITYLNNTSTLLPATGTIGTNSSQINVFGLFGNVTDVSVELVGLSHSFPDDLDFLLYAPNNINNLVFMSDAGSGGPAAALTDVNLTFSDAATDLLPDATPITPGPFKPTGYDLGETAAGFTGAPPGVLNQAGPAGTATFASAFSDLVGPNGSWKLFIDDDTSIDAGSLDGWNLTITSASDISVVTGASTDDFFFVGNGAEPDTGVMSLNGQIARFSGVKTIFFEGANGDDTFFGGSEKDNASGGADDDFLSGGDGRDKLFGDAGNDTLLGGAGDDALTGGLGVDLLIGGLGKDRFKFVTIDDSGIDALTRDHIEGFKRGEDKIDLSAIDARMFNDPGNDKFSSIIEKSNSFDGQGRIIYKTFNPSGSSNDRTIIKINTDNDAAAELTIHLKGIHNLTASDFIL